MVRSRTGCLTCRKRKLKCDEGRPVCGQCQKANRECEPSSGLTFRHQHNASMNADANNLSSEANSLGAFYNYRKAFDATAIWVKIPKGEHTFINTTNPYEDETPSPDADHRVTQTHLSHSPHHPEYWKDTTDLQDSTSLAHPHGLEVLSEAAVFSPQQPTLATQPTSSLEPAFDGPFDPASSNAVLTTASNSPRGSGPGSGPGSINQALNGMQNSASAMDSPIDPNLMSPPDRPPMSSSGATARSPGFFQAPEASGEVSLDHKEAFLLRHFSELPGRWMDLFDFGCYFGSHVPVQARSHLLLKHSICAYAAKQLHRASTQKAIVGGITTRQATMEIYEEPIDWEVEASIHYGEAVSMLKELVAAASDPSGDVGADGYWDCLEAPDEMDIDESERIKKRQALTRLHEDQVVASSTILGVYEFVSATGPAWSRHLNGTKLLMDITAPKTPLIEDFDPNSMMIPPDLILSEGRKAAFWQLARQDYLAAFINECRTRLDTEDLNLWRLYGLPLDENSFITPSPRYEVQGMQECMFANALIWLSSKICNFIAAGETSEPLPPGDRSETSHLERGPGKYGKSQAFLLSKWRRLDQELEVWYESLPASFTPSARMKPREAIFEEHERLTELTDKKRKFEEIWFPKALCAATMQHYHMARVLLLLNKPHESTARRTTLGRRFNSMRSISEECVYHCYEIIGISLARPDSAARIHSTQPLFVAGHCLTNHRERQIIIDHLKSIEKDLGWATEQRVQQLQEEWEWTTESHSQSRRKNDPRM